MIEGQEGVTWEQWVALARQCEESGFHGLFRSDHYLSFGRPTQVGGLDAWTTLAGLAAETSSVRLGSLVSPVTFRHPSLLAKSVATVDHVSGGRVELGIGAGWFSDEHAAYGFPFPSDGERFDMLAEQVEVVHRLLASEEREVSFHGRYYRLEACPALPKPLQTPHPPLLMGGGGGPRAMRLAAAWADEYNLTSQSPERCRSVRESLTAACERVGRDPSAVRLSLMTTLVTGSTRDQVEWRARAIMGNDEGHEDATAYLEERADRWLAGTTDRVLERLNDYSKAGVQRVMLQHLLHNDLDAVRQVGQDIIPAAASL